MVAHTTLLEISCQGSYGKRSKISKTFLFLFTNKILVIRLEATKCMSEKKTGKTQIRLLLKKQSDLCLHCLSMPFKQAACLRNFKTFTEVRISHHL